MTLFLHAGDQNGLILWNLGWAIYLLSGEGGEGSVKWALVERKVESLKGCNRKRWAGCVSLVARCNFYLQHLQFQKDSSGPSRTIYTSLWVFREPYRVEDVLSQRFSDGYKADHVSQYSDWSEQESRAPSRGSQRGECFASDAISFVWGCGARVSSGKSALSSSSHEFHISRTKFTTSSVQRGNVGEEAQKGRSRRYGIRSRGWSG